MEVDIKPVNTPLNLFEVIDPNIFLSFSPAVLCNPSLIIFIPKINRPNDPKRIKNFIIPQPLKVLTLTFLDHVTS